MLGKLWAAGRWAPLSSIELRFVPLCPQLAFRVLLWFPCGCFFSDCESQSHPLSPSQVRLAEAESREPRPPRLPPVGAGPLLLAASARDAPLPAGLNSGSTEWGAPFHASPTHHHFQYSWAVYREGTIFSWIPSVGDLGWPSWGWPWDVCEERMRQGAHWNPRCLWAQPCHTGALCCAWLGAQSCLMLCDPMDCSPPGSSGHGVLQARILG